MATSHYFQNYSLSGEQNLLESLIIESIKIYGHDVWYCPRTVVAKDEIFGEDALSQFNSAYYVDMYVKSYDAYEGDGQFLSKFNLEIRDQVTLTIAVRTFANEVQRYTNELRPTEGSLIYMPVADRIFVIKYINQTAIFYQLGKVQMYDVVCEMYEHSGERLNTGIERIDRLEQDYSINTSMYRMLTQDGYRITDQDGFDILQTGFDLDVQSEDVFSDNEELQDDAASIIDFSEEDPFSEGNI